MATLISLLFQGKVAAVGPLSGTEEREVAHAAFPASPPRDATARADFRAWKMVPLTSGRALASTIVNRGEADDYGRPVLRANGCLLAPGEMTGALRDLAAIWAALEDHSEGPGATRDPTADVAAFTRQVEALSIHTAPEAFARFQAELGRAGAFHARTAAVLCAKTADLYLGDLGRALDLLRPALGLLSIGRLERLHLAIGAEASGAREPVLGLAGGAPDEWRRSGLLAGLFGRKQEDRSQAAADFESSEVFGIRADGPVAIAAAIADPHPWPGARDDRDRYRVLLECLDVGGARTPFEVLPELDQLRRTVRRIEQLSQELTWWR